MIRTTRSHLYVSAVTHPGRGGRQNEDRFAVSAYRLSEKESVPSVFAIVSDGIGGHRAGEVAAEMAVETISHMIAQSDGSKPITILDRAIQVTSESIAARANDDTQRLGMGTTCACAWIIGSRLYTASVGDSRIYFIRGNEILQLTVDHTWVQEAMEKGILKAEQVHNHPNLHVIRRYLGSSRAPQVDTRMRLASNESDTQSRSNQGLLLHPGDLLLLCTDGLTDMVSDDEILATLRGLYPSSDSSLSAAQAQAGQNLKAAAHALVDLANAHGGPDNTTVVLMLVPYGPAPEKKGKFWRWALLGLAGLFTLALMIGAAVWLAFQVFLPPVPAITPVP